MNTGEKRVLIIGHRDSYRLESSYQLAFRQLGCAAVIWELGAEVSRYVRLGRAGRLFNQFVPVVPWVRKANRAMVLFAAGFQPDITVVVSSQSVQAGALAQLRLMTDCPLVLIWPDTLVNLTDAAVCCLPLYDLVASYSQSTIPVLSQLGARRVRWVPLAGDPDLHDKPSLAMSPGAGQDIDVSFIGGWRPEREATLSLLGGFDLRVWGPEWNRRSKDNAFLRRAWQRQAVFGEEFAQVVRRSKINLNIIDPTNYPAANMRFFEVPVAGGLQICSRCPEMESAFRHGEHIFYYQREEELPDLIRTLLNDEPRRREVAAAAHEKVMAQHLYKHRAQTILDELNLAT